MDLLKGIGIFLVVMGHCPDELNLHRWIYAFHMPLFAFIGGLFLRPQPFRQFAVKKMTRLLVPFFAWSLFFWVLYDLVIPVG
ncbi:acyltransferase family protein [Alistipes senegalensis]|uniref:acyltransferase family protein n=1 Tax=Alistipes senegalensis TaxID=1288121 RepID=UPI00242D22E3|nr:acyltransferase family protein [Alistipes senegalensis]MCI7307245.1 acyltransferase family protein [Alistipes senegalensis]MDY2876448.1 acyltransferase family protein [Alistipes senegalensis]